MSAATLNTQAINRVQHDVTYWLGRASEWADDLAMCAEYSELEAARICLDGLQLALLRAEDALFAARDGWMLEVA